VTTLEEVADEAWVYLPVLTAAVEATTPDPHRDALLADVSRDLLDGLANSSEGESEDPDSYGFVKSFITLSQCFTNTTA